jgi:hypothetical protein
MVESWLAHDPRFGMQELNRYGQHRVYQVKYHSPGT